MEDGRPSSVSVTDIDGSQTGAPLNYAHRPRRRCPDIASQLCTSTVGFYHWLAKHDKIEEPTLWQSITLKRVWLVNVMAVPFYIAMLICMTMKVSDVLLVTIGTPLMLLSAINLTVPSDALTTFYGSFWSGFVISLLGNVVELAIAGVGLHECLFNLVVGNMIGSGMSNLLFVAGLSIIVGKNHGQMSLQNRFAFETMYVMLIQQAAMVSVPVLLQHYDASQNALLFTSRLFALFNFMMFVMHTVYTYGNRSKMADDSASSGGVHVGFKTFGFWLFKGNADGDARSRSLQRFPSRTRASHEQQSARQVNLAEPHSSEDDIIITVDESSGPRPRPRVSLLICAGLIVFGIVSVATTSTAYVDAVVRMIEKYAIPVSIIYYVIMPAVGNLPEHFIALYYGWKGNLDSVLFNSVNSNIQVVMGMLNALILIAWLIGKPMTFASDMGTVIFTWFAVVIFGKINFTGRAGPLEGYILTMGFITWVVVTFFGPLTPVLPC